MTPIFSPGLWERSTVADEFDNIKRWAEAILHGYSSFKDQRASSLPSPT